MSDNPEHFREKIREVREKQLKELDLSNDWYIPDYQKLTEIPAEVFELEQLEVLNFSNNLLTFVPDTITRLQNLTVLDLSSNELAFVSSSIARLHKLTSLNLNHNLRLLGIPESISQLPSITELHLRNIRFDIPEWISHLQNLTLLDLAGTGLITVPKWISQPQNLTKLDLSDNELTAIPDQIAQLQNLTFLILPPLALKLNSQRETTP